MIVNKPNKKKKGSPYTVFYVIMAIIFSVIIGKLLYLQVYKHQDYKEKADTGSTRFISEKAPRGIIYDDDGNVLATNKQNYVLTYMQTDEADKAFYSSMNKIFNILKENNEKFLDDLLLKINSSGKFYYNFKTSDTEAQKLVELRFKKDRGLNDLVQNTLYKDHNGDFTDDELNAINDALLSISIEDTFYYLVDTYNLYEMLLPEGYTSEEKKALAKSFVDPTIDQNSKNRDYVKESVDYGKRVTDELLKKYSLEEIRNYMVIRDAIKMKSYEGYKAVTIANNIKRDTAFIIYQKLSDLPGVDVSLEPVRYYPFGNLASHILGYVSSITGPEETVYELMGYDASTDLVGASGIESAFEDQLKGNKGGTTVKVNSQGRNTETLFELESYPGNNVHLTIDKDIQYAAQEALKDTLETVRQTQPSATRGAVIAIEVKTGRVLAMASYPDYNPNDFAIPGELSDEKYEQYFSPDLTKFGTEHIQKTHATKSLDELFPLNEEGAREDFYDIYPRAMFNYATLGKIPPGSVFKPLTSIAGLMEGVISTTEYMNDTSGWWERDGFGAENFQHRANGPTDLRLALEKSSNYFYYETGYRLWDQNGRDVEALDSLAEYVWKFGLGVDPNSPQAANPTTGIEIEEGFGQTYNFTSWKNKIIETPMYSLVEALQKGVSTSGNFVFIPLDISKSEEDSEELKNAKEAIKNKIKEILEKVGTDEQMNDYTEVANLMLPEVKTFMKESGKYKQAVADYESKTGKKADLDEQADSVANAIAEYIISEQTTQITSFAQIVMDAIGQGMNNLTPLQIANYVATLANGGERHKVMLVDKITSPTGEVIQEFNPEVVDNLEIPSEYLQAVKEGMRRVNTSSENGMAYQSFGEGKFPIAVCGKTGTADFGTEEQYSQQGRKPYGNYISFAPMDDPEIAIFSTLYDGNKGSDGAPIHKAIYEAFFKEELLKLDPSYASKSSSFVKYVQNAPKDNNTTNGIETTTNESDNANVTE